VLLAPPAWQTNALAALLNECTPVRLCGRLYGRGFPEFHPQLERATRHLSDLSALRKLDPIGYWYEILSLAGEQPTGFVLGREDAPELWDAVLRDANAVKIVFKPHPTDVWHCMQAELLCRPTDEQQDYLDRAMHLSWNHEAGRRGSGIVHAIECYPWQLAPDASSVGRVITDLGGVAPDPDVVERRLSYSPGPSSLAARA
jgi:hypothetical protein